MTPRPLRRWLERRRLRRQLFREILEELDRLRPIAVDRVRARHGLPPDDREAADHYRAALVAIVENTDDALRARAIAHEALRR